MMASSESPRDLMLKRTASFFDLAAETVENILSFLPGRALVTALQVCHLWKDLAGRVLKRRRRWVSRLFECDQRAFNRQEAKQKIRDQIFEFLDTLDIVPLAMIVTTSTRILASQRDIGQFVTTAQDKLPVGCPIVGCVSGGIIGETSTGCPEEVLGRCNSMSILLVPKSEGVIVNWFSISKREISKNKINKESWEKTLASIAQQDIKFVLLIGKMNNQQDFGRVVVGIKKVVGKHVVVVGGLARPFMIVDGSFKTDGVVGLALGGNIHANSLVHHGCTAKCLTGSIQKLKKEEPAKSSACFMISCVGRGEPFYRLKNVESSEFRRMFPGIRLFGFFGNGEIGADMYPSNEEVNEDHFSSFLHYYSTVFSVVTFVDKKGKKDSVCVSKYTTAD